MNRRELLLTALAGALAGNKTWAQILPGEPIHLVVGFPPGGGTDVLARLLSQHLSNLWNVPIVVENRPGVSGSLAASYVAKRPPDGKTLLMAHVNNVIGPSLNPKLDYSADDFTAIALVGATPLLLICGEKQSVRTVPELVKLCRENPGQISFGSAGTGSIQHLALELFKDKAKVDVLHVPYKGGTSEINDLIAGHIDYCFEGMTTAGPQVNAGRAFALAQTSARRSSNYPDVPTVAEQGFPDYQATVWFGVVGPAGLPKSVSDRMNADINTVLQTPEVAQRLKQFGAQDGGGTVEQFANFIKSEQEKWAQIIKASGGSIDS